MNISQYQAQNVLDAALKKAMEIGINMNIAVVDQGAHLKLFSRMDNAFLGSIDIAIKKAKTAKLFDCSTDDIGVRSQPSNELYLIELTNNGLVSFGGGIPLMDNNGKIIGAVGVSGGSVNEDLMVANAGVNALNLKSDC